MVLNQPITTTPAGVGGRHGNNANQTHLNFCLFELGVGGLLDQMEIKPTKPHLLIGLSLNKVEAELGKNKTKCDFLCQIYKF